MSEEEDDDFNLYGDDELDDEVELTVVPASSTSTAATTTAEKESSNTGDPTTTTTTTPPDTATGALSSSSSSTATTTTTDSSTTPSRSKSPSHYRSSLSSGSSSSQHPIPNEMTKVGQGIVINNMTWWTTDREIVDILSPYGQLKALKIYMDKLNGRSLGYAYIEFVKKESCQRACEAVNGLKVTHTTISTVFNMLTTIIFTVFNSMSINTLLDNKISLIIINM